MTTVFERTTGGPAMHALVIGVGRYPYGGAGAGGLLGGLTTVTSPPASALAVAEWLMAGRRAR